MQYYSWESHFFPVTIIYFLHIAYFEPTSCVISFDEIKNETNLPSVYDFLQKI